MEVALSPMRPQELDSVATDASPMVINMTPTTEQDSGEDAMKDIESGQQYEKPPPLHTGADWKIVLHLPEIETWLRMTSERVRDLTYSVQQDSESKHVDVHLVQLKDICEDISDHVEQIHALLETEFSLKLLSYSVNVIVDIHTVQLLWHQLRVSVLVLRERILQGLQDANGNYTRQTDILQAFSEETKEVWQMNDRLDSLTEVDDSGQLTIKCSQNYLSLDCGITAFELSDYSPSEDLLGALGDMTTGQAKVKPFESWNCSEMEKDFPELIRSVGLLTVATDSIASKCNEGIHAKEILLPLPTDHQEEGKSGKVSPAVSTELSLSHISGNSSLCKASFTEESVISLDSEILSDLVKQEFNPLSSQGTKSKQHPHCENLTPKRSIRDCFDYNEDSPTQPTLPKRGLFLKEDIFKTDMMVNDIKNQISLMFKTEISRSTPSLLDPPDRSKLCLTLQTAYTNCPSAISQSCGCLHNIDDQNLKDTIQNHFKEDPMGVGKSNDNTRREKVRCKKAHDIPEEVASCRISGIRSNATATNRVKKPGVSALQNGISFHSLQSMEGTESDSASTSSDPCKQQEQNGQYCSERENSASPAHSPVSGSSAGSESVVSSSPVLPRNKGKKTHSSSPSHINTDGKVVEAWYGSDEYLALPSHLKQTEVLALKLENLTKLLPQKPQGETIQNIDDWELSEMNSDSELYPSYQIKKKHKRLGRVSPSSSSDIVSSVGDSIESGPLSDILSDEELCTSSPSIKKYLEDKLQRPSVTLSSDKNEISTTNKSALIQQLMQDIQHQDNYEIIWEKMEGFVSKLDEFIHWLNEAMETTENWTPPKAETDSLKLYLETHLSFKLNVDSHCALKEAVVEEGRQLLDLIVSHKSEGLKDMLQMIASQWKELQRQIKRQHSWILRALGIIKAEILATDVSAEDEEGTQSPKETLNVIDPGLMELNGTSEDALEWDEMDISNKLISINEEFSDLDQQPEQDVIKLNSTSDACANDSPEQEGNPNAHGNCLSSPKVTSPVPQVYQVYSLHNVELSGNNHISFMKKASRSLNATYSNKDSSCSPTKNLPDLMGSTTLTKPQNYMYHNGNISRHSENQCKIVQGGEEEVISNSEFHLLSDTDGTQDNSVINISESQLGNIVDTIKQNFKQEDEESHIDLLNTSQSIASDKARDLDSIIQHGPECSEEGLQGKHSVFTFYDYSYLQGSKFKLPMIMKQPSSEKAHKQDSLLHGFYFDKVPFKSEPVELKPHAPTHDFTSTDLDNSDPKLCELVEDLKKLSDTTNAKLFSTLSHSSSLDSLSVASDLFGSSVFRTGDGLHRSTSLESWLTPYKSNEDLFSCNGSGDVSGSSDSVGELSKRTLDLLNRLENIQSPLDQKIKRSISDITLQSTSQRMSLTGQLSLDIASSINEDSPASLTELSSSDDLSLCSEDIVLHRNKVPDSNASFRKHLNRSVADESDVNVSMIVNVSCTSACTDDEDDSDLLSSSTLTLTEEELGIKDEDDDSSIATDEDIYEDCNLISGLDYIKNELHTWIRPKFDLTKEKKRCNLDDEIQCCKNVTSNEISKAKDSLSIETFLNDSILKLSENNGNSKNTSASQEAGTKKQIKNDCFQVSKDHLVDDVENGNVANTQESLKDELLRITTAAMNVSTLDGIGSENECCICEPFTDSSDDSHMDIKETFQLSNVSCSPKEYQKHLQFDGHCIKKLPTEFASNMKKTDTPDMASVASMLNGQSRTGINEDGSDCFAALKSNEAGKNASAGSSYSCCNCDSVAFDKRNGEDCSVHNFVMEIIDMASTALKNKSQPESEPAAPHSLAQIREKVLEHSHRPIQLRKGDFYSYLSLSSHDSDCGEVTKYVEEKSSTPVPLDFADDRENIECFFEACPEEERVEQQMYVANSIPEVPLMNYEGLDLIVEPKTSAECSSFSFLNEEMDINVPGSLSQMVSDNFKNVTSESLNLDTPTEGSVLNSFPNSSKENNLEESHGIPKAEEEFALSVKAPVESLQVKPNHVKENDVLHQDTKTLICEEKLLHLHQERHINTHR
ncbi:A-kinase anchor protein 6 isoform X7 [Hemicordylus capensis]|uniref:A-kinase anchor protein 6 isoform X7 n=1 Tax=Hemicordylus capensis TaxID=884348 RepID=UPI002302FB00|nr:A-kinase anchor protein 6 isoform X7 [Hemicordylus capensis]